MEQVYYEKLVAGGGDDDDVVHRHHYLHHHQSPMKPQRSFSDTDATTDESSQASSSFASSPTSSYTECEEVCSLSEQSSSDISDAFHGAEVIVVGPSSRIHLDELSERAQLLLQREQAPEYKVENYFLRTNSSVDPMCRSMMMDWSFSILEFSFPPPPSSPDQLDPIGNKTASKRRRKRSIEALHLIYATFSYIDRISTLNDLDPDQFKLLSMVCLHLAAKTSGLFGNCEHEASWPIRKGHDAVDFEQQQLYFNPCQNKDSPFSSPPTLSPTAFLSDRSDVDASRTPCNTTDEASEEVCGQTIFSTPASSSSRLSSFSKSEGALNCKPRPSMELLSLSALCTLYGGDVHIDEMMNVEWSVLQQGLQWKLTGVCVFEWLDVFLDLAKLRPSAFFVDWQCIREQAWAQLETAIENHCFMTSAPSAICLAAFLNAIEEYNEDVLPGMFLLDRKLFEGVMGLCLEDASLHDLRCALME
ncbi:hypothetical protein ACHAXM_005918 [Skeletonema potamos]|jgi:hypothetical protein